MFHGLFKKRSFSSYVSAFFLNAVLIGGPYLLLDLIINFEKKSLGFFAWLLITASLFTLLFDTRIVIQKEKKSDENQQKLE